MVRATIGGRNLVVVFSHPVERETFRGEVQSVRKSIAKIYEDPDGSPRRYWVDESTLLGEGVAKWPISIPFRGGRPLLGQSSLLTFVGKDGSVGVERVSKENGRKWALKAALRVSGLTQEERRAVWNAYHSRRNGQNPFHPTSGGSSSVQPIIEGEIVDAIGRSEIPTPINPLIMGGGNVIPFPLLAWIH